MNAMIQRLRWSSFPTEKIEALRRISLSSRSRRFSAFKRLISADSSLEVPGRASASISALDDPAAHGLLGEAELC
jgi:hypothetical protein